MHYTMGGTGTAEMKRTSLADILRPYANRWVALSWERNKVLAIGDSLSEVVAFTKQKGYPKPIFTYVPDPRYGFLPTCG